MSNATQSNPSRCYPQKAPEQGPPLFQHGDIVFQAHHVGWLVTGFFTSVAAIASFWLVNKHLQWYTNKREQRYIIRILFMVPLYAIISLASYLFWNQGTPLILIRDAYESIVLTAFLYLLLMYLSPDPDEQKAIFLEVGLSRSRDSQSRRSKRHRRDLSPELLPDPDQAMTSRAAKSDGQKKQEKPSPLTHWMFPFGWVRWKPVDGLHFFWMMKWGVLQYCVVRPTTTLFAVILNSIGLYCEDSWNLKWGHPYIITIISISVSIAMYCLIQLYFAIAWHLVKHRPLLKLFAIKVVVFLTFWQATFLSVLAMFGVVKNTKYMTADEINIGFGAILEAFEMMIIAFLHIKAFTYKPYRPFPYTRPPPQRTSRLKSLGHAMDFRETWREIAAGAVWMWDWHRGKERRVDRGVWREVHLEGAMGRGRSESKPGVRRGESAGEAEIGIVVEKDDHVRVDEAPQTSAGQDQSWFGIPNGRGYQYSPLIDQGYLAEPTRERMRSDDLGTQIENELQRRGYDIGITNRSGNDAAKINDEDASHKPHRSWWSSIYRRLSQSGFHKTDDLPPKREKSYSHRFGYRSHSRHHPPFRSRRPSVLRRRQEYEYGDPPPSAFNRMYQDNQHVRDESVTPTVATVGHQQHDTDVLTPLAMDLEHQHQCPGATQPFPAPIRSDSLLCRVFSHESPMTSPVDHENEGAHDLSQGQAHLRPWKVQSLAAQLPGQHSMNHVAKEAEAGVLHIVASTPEPHAESAGPVFGRLHRRESAFVRLGSPSPPCFVEPQANSGPVLSHSLPSSDELHQAPSPYRREPAQSKPRNFLVSRSPKPLPRERTPSGPRHCKKSPGPSIKFSQSPGHLHQQNPITDQPTSPEAVKLRHPENSAVAETTIPLPPPTLPIASPNTTVPPPRPRRLAPVRTNRRLSQRIDRVSQLTSNRSPDSDYGAQSRTDGAPIFLVRQPQAPGTSLPVVFNSPDRLRSLPQLLDSSSSSRYPSADILNTPSFLPHNSANRW